MSDGVPPPPGGYGLHVPPPPEPEPERKQAPAPERVEPAVQPFRSAAPFEGVPVAQPSRRWVGLPIVGIALLSLRFLLLCARTSTPSYSYDPVYVPTLPTTDWAQDLPTLANPLPEARAGRVAVDDSGTAWFDKSGDLYKQTKNGTPAVVATGQGGVYAIGVQKGVPYWLTALGVHRLVGEEVETVSEGAYETMLVDGDDAYLVASDGATVARLPLGKKGATESVVAKIKSTDPDAVASGPIAADDAWLYFVFGKGVARVAKKGANQVVTAAWVEVDVTSMAADKGSLWISNEDGVVAIGKGGAKKVIYGESVNKTAAILYGDVVVAGDDVYFTELGGGSDWHVRRVGKSGTTGPDLVTTTLSEPHLTARKGVAYWSTPSGVSTPTL